MVMKSQPKGRGEKTRGKGKTWERGENNFTFSQRIWIIVITSAIALVLLIAMIVILLLV